MVTIREYLINSLSISWPELVWGPQCYQQPSRRPSSKPTSSVGSSKGRRYHRHWKHTMFIFFVKFAFGTHPSRKHTHTLTSHVHVPPMLGDLNPKNEFKVNHFNFFILFNDNLGIILILSITAVSFQYISWVLFTELIHYLFLSLSLDLFHLARE